MINCSLTQENKTTCITTVTYYKLFVKLYSALTQQNKTTYTTTVTYYKLFVKLFVKHNKTKQHT